jgi:hypothetical protein
MKIVAAGIYDVDFHPWKPPIILRLVTDEGIYGLGVTLNEDLVARCPRIHIA